MAYVADQIWKLQQTAYNIKTYGDKHKWHISLFLCFRYINVYRIQHFENTLTTPHNWLKNAYFRHEVSSKCIHLLRVQKVVFVEKLDLVRGSTRQLVLPWSHASLRPSTWTSRSGDHRFSAGDTLLIWCWNRLWNHVTVAGPAARPTGWTIGRTFHGCQVVIVNLYSAFMWSHPKRACDVYVGGKVRVSEFMISLDLQHCGSK